MTRRVPHVAKVLITVTNGASRFLLLSRKRAEGQRKHGRLELLGGHIGRREGPFDGLVRELAEEEGTGVLAEHARSIEPRPREVPLRDAVYHTFQLTISFEDYLTLTPDPRESLGFLLVPITLLKQHRIREHLTERTQELLTQLKMLG